MKRKLIKVGTSAAVLIPADVLKKQGVKIGDVVEIEISKKSRVKKPAVDPALLEWTEKLMKRYEPALKKLAHS
jgi:antitoxin component of MazEF toxin-antitoxin module